MSGIGTSINAASLELPDYKHLPGSNPRPDCATLESVAGLAPPLTEDSTAKANIAWHYGIRLFNAGYYWESHEVLEAVWVNALPNSRERYLLQAVIHLANARLKQRMSRQNAVRRLSTLALECLNRAWPNAAADTLMGISYKHLEQLLTGLEYGSEAGRIQLMF